MKRFTYCAIVFFFSTVLLAQGTYYNSIDTSSTSFVSELSALIYPHTKISYDQFDETNVVFVSRDTTGGQKVVSCVYSGQNYVYTPPFAWTTFSREHTWCYSWMPTYGSTSGKEYSDQHHLFPTNQNNANGVRSNHPLGNVVTVTSSYLAGKYGQNASGHNVYEPRDSHKGDAARALFYMAICYNGVDGKDWSFNYLNNTTLPALSEAAQNVDLLVQWHNQDPPDQWEKDRNEYIYSIQGNRNPFIDHPEYVSIIDFNTLTKKTSPVVNDSLPARGKFITITSQNFSYSQNFNALNTSSTNVTWTDTTTVSGWYSNKTTYAAGTGSSTTGGLYSFGSTNSSDRSLGSVSSGASGTIQYAVRFKNSIGASIASVTVQYVGEQWRDGGNITAQKIVAEYKINADSITNPGVWTPVTQLDFTTPIATSTPRALDGNLSENKITKTATISFYVPNGDEIWLRWTDVNDAGNDHGISIDDFSFVVNQISMPVELVSFTAESKNNNVALHWKTATEVNNYGFEIEKKWLGDELGSMQWETIGFVEGNGTTNAAKEYSFTDKNLSSGRYLYRLKQIDRNGEFEYSQSVEVTINNTPKEFVLEQNYPNPFNPSTTIGFTLRETGLTSLKIYDAIGREVAVLVNEVLESGVYHQKTFSLSHLSSGIYIARLSSSGKTQVIKLILMK